MIDQYRDIVSRIERARDVPAKEVSFQRARQAIEKLDVVFPEHGEGVILVAGTNGKGTVCKTLETLLSAKGERVGLFTSPHMIDTTERIRSFGRDLTHDEFVAAFILVEPIVAKLGLSHFEILTLMMTEVFFGGRVRPRVERAIIEVGVGGRLDPTRLIPHQVSVIAPISLDHQEILGGSLASIAREKLGIVDPGNLVVHAGFPAEALPVVQETAARLTPPATWIESENYPFSVEEDDRGRPIWVIETPWGNQPLALSGARAVANTSLALTVLEESGLDVSGLLPALGQVSWPCRMERFEAAGRTVYLSGDHNAQGAESLREILENYRYERLWLVVGIGKNKPAGELLRIFSSFPHSKLVLTLTPFRPGDLSAYGEWLEAADGAYEDPDQALRHALRASGPDDLIVVTGSLYLAGHLRKSLIDRAYE